MLIVREARPSSGAPARACVWLAIAPFLLVGCTALTRTLLAGPGEAQP